MLFSDSYITEKRASFKNQKVVTKIVELINTYSIGSFLKEDTIQKIIAAKEFGQWQENQVQLHLDFRKYDHMNISVSCPEFEMAYSYEANDQFPNGYHTLRVEEKTGTSATKAFQEFVELIINHAFAANVEKIVHDENGKSLLLIDLNYFDRSASTGDSYNLSVTKKGVHWGVSGPPQITMSAVSGAGGTVNFEAFINGELDDFVLRGFGKKVLEEVKKNVRLRLK